MIGIYKITSPTGRIYIGQSIDIEKRRKMYINNHCHKQQKLHASLCKYGFNEHDFEVIEECEWDLLNEREEYWIYFYGTFNSEIGMNLSSGGLNKRVSEETKLKISIGNSGKKKPWLSELNKKPRPPKSKETREKISIANKGRKHKPESIKNMQDAYLKREPISEEVKLKMSKSAKEKVFTAEHRQKLLEGRLNSDKTGKKVINKVTGEEFKNLTYLCREKGFSYGYMKRMLRGACKNTSDYEYLLLT